MNKDPDYKDLRLHCRCTGIGVSQSVSVGNWCGRLADSEVGVCDRCRRDCLPTEHAQVLTVEQVVERDTPWLREQAKS